MSETQANGPVVSNGVSDHSPRDGDVTQRSRQRFECTFVTEPPKEIQTKCSICSFVLRDPYLLVCCGADVCRSCIEPIARGNGENNLCPLCNETLKSVVDIKHKRILNAMKVYCSYKEGGCEWVGLLGDLPEHINLGSGTDNRLIGCPFALLDCDLCNEAIKRQEIKKHEAEECPQRAYSCNYCNDHHSTYEYVTTNHWPVCPFRPAPCPNKCGAHPEQRHLEAHLKKDCPLEITDCAFSFAGCTERMARKDIPTHVTKSLATHVILQATSHQKQLSTINELEEQLKETKAKVSDLEKTNEVLKNELEQEYKSELLTVHEKLKMECDQQLETHATKFTSEVVSIRQEMKKESDRQLETHKLMVKSNVKLKTELVATYKREVISLHNHTGLVPVTITVSDFDHKMRLATNWSSYPFYTHSQGYKMILQVFTNGYIDAENSYVTVGLCLMQGEFDDYLKWPLQADITIQLLNQEDDKEHCEDVVRFTLPESTSRVTPDVHSPSIYARKGEGIDTFFSYSKLVPKYLKNNCLQFRICNVRLL